MEITLEKEKKQTWLALKEKRPLSRKEGNWGTYKAKKAPVLLVACKDLKKPAL